ncbi:MAG: hypothetical protein E7673_02705 [Ruminococcaceae bacterium]|nr:hypothetical protein [Oscillospiraceae bacterium]
MKGLFLRLVGVLLTLSVSVSSVFLLSACREYKSPYPLMLEFCQSYGISDTVFSSSVKEGAAGYVSESFFEQVYGEKPECVSEYAVVFLSSLDVAGECALFLCYSEYDALIACDILQIRLDLIKSMGISIDTSYAKDAVIFKSGRYAVMCVLSDNERAKRLWQKIL